MIQKTQTHTHKVPSCVQKLKSCLALEAQQALDVKRWKFSTLEHTWKHLQANTPSPPDPAAASVWIWFCRLELTRYNIQPPRSAFLSYCRTVTTHLKPPGCRAAVHNKHCRDIQHVRRSSEAPLPSCLLLFTAAQLLNRSSSDNRIFHSVEHTRTQIQIFANKTHDALESFLRQSRATGRKNNSFTEHRASSSDWILSWHTQVS